MSKEKRMEHSSLTCPLRVCERRILSIAAILKSTRSNIIAEECGLSIPTVDTYFKRIKSSLAVSERHLAVQLAQENGWLETIVPLRGGGGEKSQLKVEKNDECPIFGIYKSFDDC
jgi:DNA-binding CsgD family transcriptional regulator